MESDMHYFTSPMFSIKDVIKMNAGCKWHNKHKCNLNGIKFQICLGIQHVCFKRRIGNSAIPFCTCLQLSNANRAYSEGCGTKFSHAFCNWKELSPAPDTGHYWIASQLFRSGASFCTFSNECSCKY